MPEYDVTYSMVDFYNRPTQKTFTTVSTMADEASALAAAAGLATDLANISEARILSYTLKRRTVYVDTADSGANKDEGAILSIRKADNFLDSIRVPAPINSIFDTDGDIDLADVAVTAFVANFLTGGDFTFSDGEQGAELVTGYLEKA